MEDIFVKMKEIMIELLKNEEIQQEIADIARIKNGCMENTSDTDKKRIAELEEENKRLKESNEKLKEESDELRREKEELKKESNAFREEKEDLSNKNNMLNQRKIELEKEKEDLENKNRQLRKENASQLQELESKQNELTEYISCEQELLSKIQPVEKAAELWQELMQIDEVDLSFLDRLSGDRNIFAYIAVGSDYSRIKQLWGYVRNKAQKDEDELVIKGLSDYFDMCVEIYNTTNNREDKLEKENVVIGSEFNSEIHIKTSQSSLSGYITKILVNGYRDRDGKVAFQPVVRVQ